YNRAPTRAFGAADGKTVEIAPGPYPVPFGTVVIGMDPAYLVWGDRELVDFEPAAELAVHGMRNRYRLAGIGAPLAARAVPRAGVDVSQSFVPPRTQVPTTLLLRLPPVDHRIVSA